MIPAALPSRPRARLRRRPELPHHVNRAAFTLIEMLVVMAIISALAGMVLPALSRARMEGRSTKYVNALRNIGAAFTMYSSDYDEYRPLDDAATTGSNVIYRFQPPDWDGPAGLGLLRANLAREMYFPGEHTHVQTPGPQTYRSFESWGKVGTHSDETPQSLESQWFYLKAGYGRPLKHANSDYVAAVIPFEGVSADNQTVFFPEDGTTTWILADSGRVKSVRHNREIGIRQFNVLDPSLAAECADQELKH